MCDRPLPPHVAELTASLRSEFSSLCTSLLLPLYAHTVAYNAFMNVLVQLSSISPEEYDRSFTESVLERFASDLSSLQNSQPQVSSAAVDRLLREVESHLGVAGRLMVAAFSRRRPQSSSCRSISVPLPVFNSPPPLNVFLPLPLAVVVAEATNAAARSTVS